MRKIISYVYTVGKKEYKLSEAQHNFIQRENMESNRTFFWFDKFAINLNFTSSIDRVVEVKDELPKLPEFTPEEKEKAQRKLDEIRSKLND